MGATSTPGFWGFLLFIISGLMLFATKKPKLRKGATPPDEATQRRIDRRVADRRAALIPRPLIWTVFVASILIMLLTLYANASGQVKPLPADTPPPSVIKPTIFFLLGMITLGGLLTFGVVRLGRRMRPDTFNNVTLKRQSQITTGTKAVAAAKRAMRAAHYSFTDSGHSVNREADGWMVKLVSADDLIVWSVHLNQYGQRVGDFGREKNKVTNRVTAMKLISPSVPNSISTSTHRTNLKEEGGKWVYRAKPKVEGHGISCIIKLDPETHQVKIDSR